MSSSMITAQGATIAIGDGATPETFTTIAETQTISWGQSADTIDTTAIDDTAESVIPGLKRGAELSLAGGLDPTDSGQIALKQAADTPAAGNYKLTASNGTTTRTISAICTAYNEDLGVNEKHGWSATLKIVGVPTKSEA